MNTADFEKKKEAFGFRCATCGAVEGEPDSRYGDEKVELRQGCRDPRKPTDDLQNIIPQCANCNRAYKDDFVFDERGRAYAVAGIGPVRRASKAVKQKILESLDKDGDITMIAGSGSRRTNPS